VNNELPLRPLGKTGMHTTALGYGAMEIRGSRIWNGRAVTGKQAETVLNTALDCGINFIDTANDYGRSEEFIGKYIRHRKNEFFLATKCGCHVQRKDENTDETPHVWTRENLFRGLEQSLERLHLDCVDLMQLHNPTVEDCRQGDLVDVLKEMKQQGKIRWLGCSSTLPHLATFIEWGVFDTFQIPCSALERKHEQAVSRAAAAGAGVIVRGGVARGEPGEGHGSEDKWHIFEQAELDELREYGESRTGFLLRYLLSNPAVSTTIVGSLEPKHMLENVEAVRRGPLSPTIYAEARRRLNETGEKPEALV
jgi:aryl-alcohol dehydrogenase-like predicted oxidoreductase